MALRDRIIAVNRCRLGLDAAAPDLDRALSLETGADCRLCVFGPPDPALAEFSGGAWRDVAFPGYLQPDGGLAWSPDGPWNPGRVLDAGSLSDAWTHLDAEYGGDSVRLLTPVRTESGEAVANIYAGPDASRARLLMLDGMNIHAETDFPT